MPPPFVALTLHEFKRLIDTWKPRRQISEVHMHHTWQPNHAQFHGHDSIVSMWRHHTRNNGWSDIAQHVTIDPFGVIWTGRHWDLPPASSSGRNGSRAVGPFMFEMVGDFDAGRDAFKDPQRDSALWVVALLQEKFDLPGTSLKFHRDLGSPKSCPGTAIDYDKVVADVEALRGKDPPRPRERGPKFENYDPATQAQEWLRQAPTAAPEDESAEPEEGLPSLPTCGRAAATRVSRAPVLDGQVRQQLRHHVVNLSNGLLSDSGEFQTDEGDVRRIFEEDLPARVRKLRNGNKLPIVFYAHGGLNSEADGLAIAAAQTPWWLSNGVYPICFVWETGLWETLARMIGLSRARGPLSDLSDGVIEGIVRAAHGESVWQAMKFAAARAVEPGGGATIVLDHLAKFLKASGQKVTLHAVGHSAGSIFHAYLLPKLLASSEARVDSLCLLAPAITVADFKARLVPHVGERISRVVMLTMNKDAELADTVASLYHKSLLYLIHRALEPRPAEPILGLEESVRADSDMRKLFGLGQRGKAAVAWSPTDVRTGRRASRSLTHGNFDNDAATMESVAREILDLPDAAPVTPFADDPAPREAVLRIADTSVERLQLAETSALAPVAPFAWAGAQPTGSAVPIAATGRRRALCIGIDDYPRPEHRLYGCVADACEWASALTALGFEAMSLHNAQATRHNIMTALSSMVSAANSGDTIVLQFAAHGTQLEDTDGDEDDAKDEAFCPVDFAEGQFIVDDDFRRIFSGLRPGVVFTCFFDTCHSGTITRLGVGRPADRQGARARFIVATSAMNAAHRAFRANQPRAQGSAGREAMRQVVFAACKPEESALENNGRGDFSVRAVPLLRHAGQINNKRFAELVTAAFGNRPQQNPNLDCAPSAEDDTFLFGQGSRAVGDPASENRAADLLALMTLVTRLAR